ncbi:hypothetical protein JL721_3446 [Aureococcus anophagefferens]|nr:hypothetical protein JL721_3446 [Aureococcus anophagefferens]
MILVAAVCEGKIACTGQRPHFVATWLILTQLWSLATAVLIHKITEKRGGAEKVLPRTAAATVDWSDAAALDAAFANWVEYDSSSTHAVLHSSLGVWLSPHYPILGFALCALNALALRRRSRPLFLATNVVIGVACAAEALSSVGRASAYLVAFNLLWAATCGFGLGVVVAVFPHKTNSWRATLVSFKLWDSGGAVLWGLFYVARPTVGALYLFFGMSYLASMSTTLSVLSEAKYREVLRRADDLARSDARRYDDVWAALAAPRPPVAKVVEDGGTGPTPARALGRTPRPLAEQVADLEASRSRAAASSAAASGGVPRAFQKAWRSYAGDHRKLCDVVRASLVFDDVDEIAEALKRVVDDPDLVLVPQAPDKNRFAAPAGVFGYRDLQLAAVLRTDEAKKRKLDGHVFEIQLHLRAFEHLKREGGGHRTSVSSRNLRCS